MTCQFGVLGDVHIRRDGQELYPGPPQQSAVPARLLLAEGRPVTTDELVNGLWGRDILKTAVVTVRTYISRFRNILRVTSGYTIPFTRAGYLLPVDERSLDLLAFHARVAAARQLVGVGEPRSALGQLDDALALWRDVRAMFLDELGIGDLRDLRQRILRADPDLLLPTVGARRHLGSVAARRSSSIPSNAGRGWSSGSASRSFPISHPVLLCCCGVGGVAPAEPGLAHPTRPGRKCWSPFLSASSPVRRQSHCSKPEMSTALRDRISRNAGGHPLALSAAADSVGGDEIDWAALRGDRRYSGENCECELRSM
jgi:hypothetical protein